MAIWARRLASLALPLLILPVIMHRERLLDSPAFLAVILLAGVVAALTVIVSVIALVRLWYTGDQGWGRALSGLLIGTLCLFPFAYYGGLALEYPPVTDIATVARGELPLVFEPDTPTIPPPSLLTPAEQQRLFPNATTRDYPLDIIQLFALVDRLVTAQGWDVRQRREPIELGEIGRINARIVTIPGWREEAVLRVTPTAEGAAVDMRSASIGAPHDFGSNGNRISDFLVALDNEVTAFLRDNPTISGPVVTQEEAAPDVETGPAEPSL
ncbi:DUF1499 domain-containing protein [Devosia aurantiaca]|uniref:DUF1499 domain-containing protein n=1 Tax=Devosia aurantiaca TaxID=2714858 RepID=A0A6M1SKI8_9HYPH|nr:DUF1499 domain-containing protein [Devosia aurantiaca]NGP17324.1 DUF1499 domain-containing protein [Devosia aurantiaca]